MLLILELIVLGAGVGLIGGALGLGGGVIMVPAFLLFVEGMDAHTAKGTSLLIIVFVAAVNAWQLGLRLERVPWAAAGNLATGAIAGSYLGAWATTLMPETAVLLLFVALMLVMAWKLFHNVGKPESPVSVHPWWLRSPFIGAYSGIAGGATGTGGGLILVPLALQTGIATNQNATALSNMVMVAVAAAGSIAHLRAAPTSELAWTVGQVNFYIVPWVFLGAQAGSLAGRHINHRLSLRWRRISLGVVLLLIVAAMVYRAWR